MHRNRRQRQALLSSHHAVLLKGTFALALNKVVVTPAIPCAWLNFFTLTFWTLGRNHICVNSSWRPPQSFATVKQCTAKDDRMNDGVSLRSVTRSPPPCPRCMYVQLNNVGLTASIWLDKGVQATLDRRWKLWNFVGILLIRVKLVFCQRWKEEADFPSFIAKFWTCLAGAELGRATAPPKILPGPPKIFQVSFWKSYTDHWQLPLLQNWTLQWPPQMKMSGSAPVACRITWRF